jgi:hypothetical protein
MAAPSATAVSTADGEAVEPWNPWTDSALGVHDVVAHGGAVILGGDFRRAGGGSRARSRRQQGFALFR